MPTRRILVLTYYYPPQPGSGSNRWAAMVKYLRRLGHDLTVITAAPPGTRRGWDGAVLRTTSLNSSVLLRRALLRPDRSTAAPATGAMATRVAPPVLWRGIVPDPWLITWSPYAFGALRQEIRRNAFDCLITSSPAESTHLLGLMLGRRRPAWVADLRDGWCFEPLREQFPLAVQRTVDRRMEERVVRTADIVVGATAPITSDLHARFGTDAWHIPNGFDPEVEVSEPPAELDPRRLTLVHTGPLLGPRGRDPRPLLAAVRRLLDDEPELADRLQLLVAGRSEFDEASLLDEAKLGEVVRHLGYLPRPQVLALQRQARALILLTSTASCEATGKLYEYLAAGRPIIALAGGNEAARIVRETNTGVVVPPGNVEAIALALRAALEGELDRRYHPRDLEPYTYPAPAERMAEAVEAACRARPVRRVGRAHGRHGAA